MTTTTTTTNRRPVLVTGATGCVGALLVEELLGAGYEVVATDRPGCLAPAPRRGLTWIAADLTQPSGAPTLVQGVGAVIHTAAWVDIAADFAAQAPINLHAVKWLYDAAEAAGVERFVHYSSGSIYRAKAGPLVEDDPVLPTSAYELCKLLAEDLLRARIGQGPAVTILRPALIYGPRGKVLVAPLATLPRLLGGLDGWIPGLRGGPRTNLVHGLDAARAALHLLEHPQPDGATFNVACPDVLTAGELLATVFRVGGRRQMDLEIPYPASVVKGVLPLLKYQAPFRVINRAGGALWKRVVRQDGLAAELAPRADMEAMEYLGGDTVFDASRLMRTGFELAYPTFLAGWIETVRWYQEHGWLPETPLPDTTDETQSQAA